MSSGTIRFVIFGFLLIVLNDLILIYYIENYVTYPQIYTKPYQEVTKLPNGFIISNIAALFRVGGHWLHNSHHSILSAFTIALAIATSFLAVYTYRLWNDSTEGIAAAKKSADAVVKSAMPVLFPYVTDMSMLHPLDKIDSPFRYDANIFIAFENYGKTPAAIKEVRGKLYLAESDILPKNVDTSTLRVFPYKVIVPGEFRAKDLKSGALDFKQPMEFSQQQYSELLSNAVEGSKYQRFALIGQVIYDDHFENRHVCRFCIKMRMFEVQTSKMVRHPKGFRYKTTSNTRRSFQVNYGESEYNRITTSKKPEPKDDPFEAS